jgi:hypothetical protein
MSEEMWTPEVVGLLEGLADLKEHRPAFYEYGVLRPLARELVEERETIEEKEQPVANAGETLAKLRAEYDRRLEAIRQDPTLSDEGKRQRLLELYTDYSSRHVEISQRATEEIEKRVADAQERVLKPFFPHGLTDAEHQTFLMSYRDANDRVQKILNDASASGTMEGVAQAGEALEALLNQANRTGDEVLAAAIYHNAALREITPIRDAYLEDRPKAKRDWEAHVKARQEQQEMQTESRIFGHFSTIPRPPELQGYTSGGAGGDFAAAYTEHLTGGSPAA